MLTEKCVRRGMQEINMLETSRQNLTHLSNAFSG